MSSLRQVSSSTENRIICKSVAGDGKNSLLTSANVYLLTRSLINPAMNTNLMLRSGRNFKNKLWPKQNNLISVPLAKHHVQIPPRIERGPIDILKALSSTIKTEPDVEEYKFQYGRSFTVSSVYRKRILSLAFESGRKAAKWVVAENPTLFEHRDADPYIEAFSPPVTFDENSEVSEETLIDMIEQLRVESAIKVYELMKEKGVDVSDPTKQELLELVCFYNCTDKADETLLETKYFENPSETILNTWKSEGLAMKLFSEMEKNSATYSAIILGMFKYNNTTDAFTLYQEAEDENIKFDVDVYNSLIENAAFQFFHYNDKKDFILKILKKMKEENIEPNLETLNSSLKSVVSVRKWFQSKELALNLFSEFTRIGIKPSLATYYYLLEIFLGRNSVHNIFSYIIERLEKEEFKVRHVDDFKFFATAMEKCAYNLKSLPMAYRINNLLNTGNNRVFLCSQYQEARYYRSYLRVLFENENSDRAMKVYCELVPSTFLPDIGTLIFLLQLIKLRNWIQCLPRFWSDIKKMSVSDSEKVLSMIVQIICDAGSDSTKETDFEIAKEAWECVEKGEMRTGWNSALASAFLQIFSRCGDKEMAYKAFDFASFMKSSFIFLDFKSRKMFMALCIKLQDKKTAMKCIDYSADVKDSKMEDLIEQFKSGFTLKAKDLASLEKYPTREKKEK